MPRKAGQLLVMSPEPVLSEFSLPIIIPLDRSTLADEGPATLNASIVVTVAIPNALQ
jgi:hypothetical protein